VTSLESCCCRAYGLLLKVAVIGLIRKPFVPFDDGVAGGDLGFKYASFPVPSYVLFWLVRRCWVLFLAFPMVTSGAAAVV
jgi:hypothetical protein